MKTVNILLGITLMLSFSSVGGSEEPRSIDMVERTGSRLAQLDVTVRGPKGFVSDLTADDFELRVGGKYIENFIVDQVCRPEPLVNNDESTMPESPGSDEVRATTYTSPVAAQKGAPATYIFFFDQPHLKMAGRQESIDLAYELIPGLMDGHSQAMIVSNARKLKVVQEMTSDPVELQAALDELQRDREQWSTWSMEEDFRLDEVLYSLENDNNVEKTIGLAKKHQIAETWEAEKSLQRVDMVLGRLADLDPPKAFFYFADSMRRNPGEHYLAYFGKRVMAAATSAKAMETGALLSGNTLDRIVHHASGMGIRFYTVQGEGLVSEGMSSFGRGASTSVNPGTRGLRDAQKTMVDLALETGGAAFLNGIRASKILKRVQDDLSCLYLVSFPVEGFREDTPLPVRLSTSRPKVTIQTRGLLVIRSAEVQRTTRILAAFATSTRNTTDHRISGLVVPTGFKNGMFSALVQITVPGTRVPGATWDLGASLVTGEKVREDASGRILAATPGVRVVFETEMKFPPGKYELVSVAHETTTDQLLSRKYEGEWPHPNRLPVSLSPIAVVQPADAAFLRKGELKKSGSLGYPASVPVMTGKVTAVVGLVCRAKKNRHELEVHRALSGDSSAEFPVLTFPPDDDERCIQYRDLIPPDIMTEGEFRFQVTVLENGEEIATSERKFTAISEVAVNR